MNSKAIFIRRWGLILIGILLAIGGLTYGAIPHQTPYQSITKALIAHYLSGRGTGYMQLVDSPTLYIVNEGDFSPTFSADSLNHGNVLISFLYRTDNPTNIDASSESNVHLVGTAYQVERITLYHQFGQQPEIFNTSGYTQNSNGTYQHNWIAGIALFFLGLVIIGLGYFLRARLYRKKKQPNFANAQEATLEAANEQPEQAKKFHEPETASDGVHHKEYTVQTAQSPRIPTIE